jgi:Nitrate reductase gamma subunit
MANAAFLFQAHALTAWLLLAILPFTRLVHAWSVPVSYLGRAPILYRGAVGFQRSEARRSTADVLLHGGAGCPYLDRPGEVAWARPPGMRRAPV